MSTLVVSQPIFQSAMRVISSITNANPAVVTTTTNHQYVTGMIVRLNIPKGFGMQQANQLYGPITVTGNTTFSIDIDTTNMDKFLSLIALGITNGSGDLSGTVTGTDVPLEIGQSFIVGDPFTDVQETFLAIANSGAMYADGSGSGTFDVSTGAYTITSSADTTAVYFSQVLYPLSLQFAQCTPIGEQNSMLTAATRNVLGTGFY